MNMIFLIIFIPVYFVFLVPNLINLQTYVSDFFDLYPYLAYLMFGITIFCIYLSDFYNKLKFKNAYLKQKNKIIVGRGSDYFNNIRDDLENICISLEINDIEIKDINDDSIIACVIIEKNQRPIIKISSSIFEQLRFNENMNDIIFVIILHELSHVYFDDNYKVQKNIKKSVIIYFLICISCFLLIFLILELNLVLKETMLYFLTFILLLNTIFSKVICDIRYWGSIAELKADLFGIEKGYLTIHQFNLFYDFFNCDDIDKKMSDKINNGSFIYQRYKRKHEISYHPTFEFRKHVVNNWKTWNIKHYFIYAFYILKWRITKKGWKGV